MCVAFGISYSISDICIYDENHEMPSKISFFVILIYLLHIFRYLDPIKDIIRHSKLFKISQDMFYDILRYSLLIMIF